MCVTIGVWACPDRLLTGYDYTTKVCLVVLVMDSVISQQEYHMYELWLTPRIVVLGWVITRIVVLGFVYFREEL